MAYAGFQIYTIYGWGISDLCLLYQYHDDDARTASVSSLDEELFQQERMPGAGDLRNICIGCMFVTVYAADNGNTGHQRNISIVAHYDWNWSDLSGSGYYL